MQWDSSRAHRENRRHATGEVYAGSKRRQPRLSELCSLSTSRLTVPFEAIEICGEGGTISHILQSDTLTTHFKPYNEGYTSKNETIEVAEQYKKTAGHQGVLREFINCIRTGEKPVRNLEHGLYIQKILDALERSSQTGAFMGVK